MKNAPKIDLTDFLNTERHPHAATIPLGDGQTLDIKYRAADADRTKAVILEAVGGELEALGFDPEVILTAAAGRVPKGDAAARLKEALDALDEAGFLALQSALKRADGAALADVIGSWGFAQEVTAETCASLPADLKKTLLELCAAAALPVEKLDFLPPSRRG